MGGGAPCPVQGVGAVHCRPGRELGARAPGRPSPVSAPQMIQMSTGHMEGTLQLLYVLLTDCYVYLLRKGARRPWARPGQLLRAGRG